MAADPVALDPVVNSRGEKLALFCWAPAGAPERGTAVIFHGYATNATFPTVRWLAELLLGVGLRCYVADMPGHGQSDGTPGLLPGVAGLVDDGVRVVAHVRSLHPGGQHLFLAGTSMGGAIALNVARRTAVDGAVLLAPMVKQSAANLPHPVVISILRWVSYVVPWPAVISTNASDPSLQYTDPERRAECDRAEQYSGPMRLGTAATLLDTALDLHANLEEVRCPFWVGVGGREVVVDPAGPEDLHRRAQTPAEDKEFKRYPDAQHALLAEAQPLRGEIEADVAAWVRGRLGRPALSQESA